MVAEKDWDKTIGTADAVRPLVRRGSPAPSVNSGRLSAFLERPGQPRTPVKSGGRAGTRILGRWAGRLACGRGGQRAAERAALEHSFLAGRSGGPERGGSGGADP